MKDDIEGDDELRIALKALHRSWRNTWRLMDEQGRSVNEERAAAKQNMGDAMARAKTLASADLH